MDMLGLLAVTPDEPVTAELADVTITHLPPDERSHPRDAYRVEQASGKAWVVTRDELIAFDHQIALLLRMTRDE